MPDRSTCRAVAPSGTVTKNEVVELRSTEPENVAEYDGFLVSRPVTTVLSTSKSTTGVAGSSTFRMALATPSAACTVTGTLTVLFSGSTTAPAEENDFLSPSQVSLCVMFLLGPLVRVSLTVKVLVWPARRPPAFAAHRL